MERRFIALGSALAFVGVGLGAFGAHGLKERLSDYGLEIWKTGVQYHLIHAISLILVGILYSNMSVRPVRIAGWLMVAGIALFSGSLYVLALTRVAILGAITPLGGVCFLAAWATLSVQFLKPEPPK
jgi:uncharacterized membrane protein YgdD (TMEM256/DUF423 family)